MYAQWTEITYTLTYSVNGATGLPERSTDVYTYTGGAVTLATVGAMTKVGFRFDGWAETVDGTKLTSPYTPTSTRTLHARWVAASYSITYFSNSGGTAPTADTFTTGNTALTLPTQGSMARTGYTFNGWSTTINSVATKIAGSEASATLTTAAPVNLYALWTAVNYNVTYCENAACNDPAALTGSVPTDATNYNIGNTVVVKANSGGLVNTGYTFAGWTTASNGSGTVYVSGATLTVESSAISFYPKWTANTYTITYNNNGATGAPSVASTSYTTGTTAVALSGRGNMLKTGHTFTGWSTSSTGIGQTTATTTSNVTLFAIWDINDYAITFNRGVIDTTTLTGSNVATFPANTSAQYNSSVTLGINPTNISSTVTLGANTYQFFGWNDGVTTFNPGSTYVMGASAPTLTAEWIRLYAVRYALNGGSGIVDVDEQCLQAGQTCTPSQVIQLSVAPTRSGYTFAGWQDQSGAPFAAGANLTVTDTSYLLYAQWTAINYTMAFNTNGGSAANSSIPKTIGQSFTFPDPGSRTGYDFNGWINADIVSSPTYGTGTSFVTGSTGISFMATWTPRTYMVSYNWNGGAGAATNDASFTVGNTAITLPLATGHTRDGYVFDGWAETDMGTKLASTYLPTSNKLLYARWIDGSYVLSYDTVGGTQAAATSTVTRATPVTLPTPTRSGFVFDGWYKDAGSTLRYGDGGASVTPTATQQLYAKWVQNSLSGINPAHLNSLSTINIAGGFLGSFTGSHALSGTGATLTVPAGALPNGTAVQVSFVEDLTRPANLIANNNAYFTSVVVHWLTGTGASATVPVAAAGKPLVLTLTNPAIVAGAKVFSIVASQVTEIATATVDGQVTITFFEDPEFVVAATRPGSPTAVTASTGVDAQSSINWNAPLGNGGSSVTGYTVTSIPSGGSCTTSGTSCLITGLTNGTPYTFTVTATNAIGNSLASSASNSATPRLAITYAVRFNSNGGSPVGNGSFLESTTVSAPTDPTREGFNFLGWATSNGNAASIVSFPYTPATNADLDLFAMWRSNNPGNANPGGNNSPNVAPTASATPTASTLATPRPSANSNRPTVVAGPTQRPTPSPTVSENAPAQNRPVPALVLPQAEIFKEAPTPDNGITRPQNGAVSAVVNDVVVETVVTTTRFETKIEIGNSISMSIDVVDEQGNAVSISPQGVVQVLQGSVINASGSGFKPGSPVEAWLNSDPIYLGTGEAGEDGVFANLFSINSDVPTGEHTVVLYGVTPTDEVVTLALGVQVLAATDAGAADPISNVIDGNLLAGAALALIALLLALYLIRTRRVRTGRH